MGVMTCPHCEESIDSLTRTGERKYSCGSCNMVIKYDQVQPHLDEIEVIDKRNKGGSSDDSNSNSNNNDSGSQSSPNQGNGGMEQSPEQLQGSTGAISDREKIYQRGPDGLREIKKERLKNWLANSEGVGAQTEQRIIMVFDRNESVHRNPHVLYNLLDDELSASASYLNTMVQDIFSPEEEHSELLNSQGYTPWHARAGQSSNMQQGMGMGGPMNATGSASFNPSQSQSSQSKSQQQQQMQQQQGGNQGNQSSSPGDNSISREEAEMMMHQAVNQANDQGERNSLMSGLSDATDEALREMASNVGGLAGTVQRVIDEALVEYARENPEWVIENMDILQKVMGATEDASSSEPTNQPQEPQEDAKIDSALDNISSNNTSPDTPSRNSQQVNQQQTAPEPEPPTPEPADTQHDTTPQETKDTNPDLDEEYMQESEFEPEFDTSNFKADEVEPQDEPEQTQTETVEEEPAEQTTEPDNSGSGFDEIFGDIAEE